MQKPGSTIAVMGVTGSGKTSLINLIGRFYDVSEGSVLIDGIDVRDMDLKFYAVKFQLLCRMCFLFSDSIRENICFGVDEVSDKKLNGMSRNILDEN